MTQVEDINRYLTDDRIFNKINKRFMSMDPGDMRDNNQRLNPFFDKLTDAMKKQCPLFAKTYQRIIWAGSYYKGTRFGQPEEYDLNFVINLPIKERDVEFTTDRPGFTKIRTVWRDKNLHNTLNIDPKAYKELNSFIDDQSYLDQEKFRRWIKRIFSKVANATGTNNRIILDGYEPISIRESGPAFTLMFQLSGRTIDIDVVPVLVFSTNTLPPRCSKMHLLQSPSNKVRCWSAVPKPLNNSRGSFGDSRNRYWRLCFYEFEKDMLTSHNYGRMKPIIRQLKKLRDTQGWNSIASYYLETLCYHESEMFHITNKKSSTFFFFTMLERLHDAFRNRSIKYYWDGKLNLLENIGPEEMRNMERRLDNILRSIRRTIKENPYAIAKWVLSPLELGILKSSEHEITSNSTSESESEAAAQGNCVIF